jgi:hypothetical protein
VRSALLCIFVVGLSGCEPLALSLVGAGAGTALRYSFVDGVTYRTFTAPAADVKHASLEALQRMGIAFESFDRYEYGELIYARAENRNIEIEIEPISARATRVRIAAKNGGFFYDNATASEIVAQTERVLASAARGGTVNSSSSF